MGHCCPLSSMTVDVERNVVVIYNRTEPKKMTQNVGCLMKVGAYNKWINFMLFGKS